MYLSDEFFGWSYYDNESTEVDFDKMNRGHEIWRHAQNRVKNNPSEFDRVDCISSLKRAVNSRLKTIDDEYNFHKLPNLRSKKQILEKYQDYGLIRPSILKDLFEVRNLLEHEDSEPPQTDKCRYYIDITWYFLKSTDSLLQMRPGYLHYEDNESELLVGCDSNWSIDFNGNIKKHLITDNHKKDHIEIINAKIEDLAENPNNVSISGYFKMTDELRIRFARDYFGAMGYYFEDHA